MNNKEIKAQKTKNIKQIEQYLRSYSNYKIGVQSMQKQLDYIMPDITATFEVSEGSTGTFNIKSDTEKYAIDRIESRRALIIHEDIKKYQIILDSMDQALSELDDMEREFIKIRYFDRKTVQQTSQKLGYSEKYVFNLRNQVMDKLLISMRGLVQF